MLLFLRSDLVKSVKDKSEKPVPPDHGKGSQRGGQYVAREQIGFETDGSPKYRYFSTEEEHQEFIKRRGNAKGAEGLKRKVSREHTESTNKLKDGKHSLLSTSKSLNLYVRY